MMRQEILIVRLTVLFKGVCARACVCVQMKYLVILLKERRSINNREIFPLAALSNAIVDRTQSCHVEEK